MTDFVFFKDLFVVIQQQLDIPKILLIPLLQFFKRGIV